MLECVHQPLCSCSFGSSNFALCEYTKEVQPKHELQYKWPQLQLWPHNTFCTGSRADEIVHSQHSPSLRLPITTTLRCPQEYNKKQHPNAKSNIPRQSTSSHISESTVVLRIRIRNILVFHHNNSKSERVRSRHTNVDGLSFVLLPVLSHVVGKWVIWIRCTKQCLNTE